MDQAGAGVARAVTKFFPKPGKCIVFAGKGHNAGMRWLLRKCYDGVDGKSKSAAFKQDDCSELMRKKLESLRRRPPEILGTTSVSGATDPGITLLELWAEVADELSAAQERIAAEAYLARPLPWSFSMACLGWARGRRYASRYEPPAVPSISSGPRMAPMCLRSIYQQASMATQGK